MRSYARSCRPPSDICGRLPCEGWCRAVNFESWIECAKASEWVSDACVVTCGDRGPSNSCLTRGDPSSGTGCSAVFAHRPTPGPRVCAGVHLLSVAFDEFASFKLRAGGDEGNQVWCVDGAPMVLGGLDQLEHHRDAAGLAAWSLSDLGPVTHCARRLTRSVWWCAGGWEVVEREQFLQVVGDLGCNLHRPVRVLQRLGCNPPNSRSACSGSAVSGSRGLSSPAVHGRGGSGPARGRAGVTPSPGWPTERGRLPRRGRRGPSRL